MWSVSKIINLRFLAEFFADAKVHSNSKEPPTSDQYSIWLLGHRSLLICVNFRFFLLQITILLSYVWTGFFPRKPTINSSWKSQALSRQAWPASLWLILWVSSIHLCSLRFATKNPQNPRISLRSSENRNGGQMRDRKKCQSQLTKSHIAFSQGKLWFC